MRVYPVDGVKAACCCVTVREQSAMGTLAIIASADVKIEGFVLFILHTATQYEWAYARKKLKGRRTKAGMRSPWKVGDQCGKSTSWYSGTGQLGNVAY
jgi:hypothetical protein